MHRIQTDQNQNKTALCSPKNFLPSSNRCEIQGRRNEGRAKGGNADGKGNFGLMNYIYKVVDVNPQTSKPRNSYNAEIKNLYAVVTISLQIVDNKWFTMLR